AVEREGRAIEPGVSEVGIIKSGSSREIVYLLINRGYHPIVIPTTPSVHDESGLQLTVAPLTEPTEIAPTQSIELHVTATADDAGPIRATLVIESNDTTHPTFRITVAANQGVAPSCCGVAVGTGGSQHMLVHASLALSVVLVALASLRRWRPVA